jgi:antibiotic biosynthesis monooxygenase (ABM) superfamily enzyme
VVVVGSVSAPGLAILSDSWSDSEKTSRSFVGEVMDWTALWVAVMLIAVLAAPLVICARVGLLVESFISLRKVPSGAYAVVPWAENIPHFWEFATGVYECICLLIW